MFVRSLPRTPFVYVAVLAALTVSAWAGNVGSSPVGVAVTHDTGGQIALSYNFGKFDQVPVDIDGHSFLEVSIEGEAVLLEAGAPALARVARSVIIPDDAAMQVVVNEALSSFYDVPGVDIAPSKGNLYRTVDPATVPYTFGEAYSQNAFYPAEVVALGEPYILRDFRGQVVHVFPLQYNPVTHTLRVWTSLVVELQQVGVSDVNVLNRDRAAHNIVGSFHDLYQHHFVNYSTYAPDLRYSPLDETGEMLIISHGAFMTSMQPFVAHKIAIGIPTTMVDVAVVGNNATAIKSYITTFYNTHDLAFVLLVGDSTQVATPTAQGGSADPTYAMVVGTDHYPEVFVGRFSAETTAHVDTQVLRSVEYEENQATLQPWFWRATGVASNQGPGDDGEYDYQHLNVIRTKLLANGYTLADQIYDPTGTIAMVSTALNNGRGLINYTGHGSTTAWSSTGFSNSNVAALTNDNMLPFIISVACVNGQFAGYTCFAEAWLRSTHNGEPIGAIGVYMSSINQSWNPPMAGQDAFVDEYLAESYHHFGTLCYAGSCGMMDDYPGFDGYEMYDTWHVFGDPSLRIVGVTAPPTGLGVTPADDLVAEGNYGGPFTPGSVAYTLENKNDVPMDYSVSAGCNWVGIANGTGTIAPNSTVVVTVSLNSACNHMDNGVYAAQVSFVNLTDHDGDTTRDVSLTIGVPGPVHAFNMDTNPGWSAQNLWTWGQNSGAAVSYGYPDPTSGHTGTTVYGYNLAGLYQNSLPETHLTTLALDCTGVTQTTLRFWRWLNVESPSYDHAYLRISNNGTNWTTLYQNTAEVKDNAWQYQQFDIAQYADNQPTVYVRWTMGQTDSSWQYSGWNIDDVELWGLTPANPFVYGDMNCDNVVDFADINPFVQALLDPAGYAAAHPECDILHGDMNQNLAVGFEDINAFVTVLLEPPPPL